MERRTKNLFEAATRDALTAKCANTPSPHRKKIAAPKGGASKI